MTTAPRGPTVSGARGVSGGPVRAAATVPSGRARRAPDFFIVGHEKCGTSALDLMLKSHPAIFLPDVKEQKFFVPELRGARGKPGVRDNGRPFDLDGYLALFEPARADQLVGEVSPQYLRSHHAAARIAEVAPEARIIAILREPASFLRSFHLQWVSNRVETERDLRRALALEPERRAGRRIPRGRPVAQTLFYSDHVRYVEQLERYRSAFGREQMLVLIYEDFLSDNLQTVRRVQRFLGVDEEVPIEPVRTMPLNAVRAPSLKYLADSARAARRNPATASPLGRAIAALTPESFRSQAFRARWRRLVYKPPAAPDEALMRELRARFFPEVQALSEYLGRDLVTQWGYQDVR
jgi:hypothetical protein